MCIFQEIAADRDGSPSCVRMYFYDFLTYLSKTSGVSASVKGLSSPFLSILSRLSAPIRMRSSATTLYPRAANIRFT